MRWNLDSSKFVQFYGVLHEKCCEIKFWLCYRATAIRAAFMCGAERDGEQLFVVLMWRTARRRSRSCARGPGVGSRKTQKGNQQDRRGCSWNWASCPERPSHFDLEQNTTLGEMAPLLWLWVGSANHLEKQARMISFLRVQDRLQHALDLLVPLAKALGGRQILESYF